ncbi:MAG TPA: hypothetical protein VKM72_24565 [Thermoanaerobaculia bacterium]|nr:hypothetical protein [Thermoanaerobaculia bacterium]
MTNPGASPGSQEPAGSGQGLRDGLFVGSIVLLSTILYLGKLGFYSDDWPFLATLHLSPDRSLPGLFQSLYGAPEQRMRPVMFMFLSGTYWLFGLDPLGYHVTNALILTASALLLHRILVELACSRRLVLAVPLVFILLPQYATNRFWLSAFSTNVSMAFYFLSLLFWLRMARAGPKSVWAWLGLSLLALLGSALAYEVFLPLFLLHPVLLEVCRRRSTGSVLRPIHLRIGAGLLLSVLGLMGFFKVLTTTRQEHTHLAGQAAWFARLLASAVAVDYGELGVGLPRVVWKILRDDPDPAVCAVAVAVLCLVFSYLEMGACRSDASPPGPRASIAWIFGGVTVFFAGYAIFLFTRNAEVSATGIGNRVSTAATLGVALSLVGGAALIGNLLPSGRWRGRLFSFLIASLCAGGALTINTLASFWESAYDQERAVVSEIRQRFPALPAQTTLLLDGVCPYHGPAVVFESNWDLAGALRILYRDWSLQADVVTPNLRVTQQGISTSLYHGSLKALYPYNDRLLIYHRNLRTSQSLPDAAAARAYFARFNPDRDSGCPQGREGQGVPVF